MRSAPLLLPLLLPCACGPHPAESMFWYGPGAAPMGTASSGVSGTTGVAGGGGAGGDAGEGGASGSGGSEAACTTAADCPGEDTECARRTCIGGICAVNPVEMGTLVDDQTAGDCVERVCNGMGAVILRPLPIDTEDDSNDCTLDRCVGSSTIHEPHPAGFGCSAGVCADTGLCVECIDDAQCQNEVCIGNACRAPACDDGRRDGTESDVDCGGSCNPCANESACFSDSDCASGTCASGTCACGTMHLLISEVRTSGPNGAEDEFVEVYNPTDESVVLGNFVVDSGAVRLFGPLTINVFPRQRYVIGGAGFTGVRQATVRVGTSLSDVGRVTIGQMGAIALDTLCYCSGSTCGLPAPADCEGQRAENPNGSGPWVDASMTRRPVGYSCSDTDDNATDFRTQSPSTPGAP